MSHCFVYFLPFVLKNPLLSAGRTRFSKIKDQFLTQKKAKLDQLLTLQYVYIYIYMAKASFSAYVLVKVLLKTGEKVHFPTKKSTTDFGLPFCFFPFPFFASKWLKYVVFALQKDKKVGRKRGLRHIYTYIYMCCKVKAGPRFGR